jgi:ABC-type methionine transport system ATPase subunit
LAEQISYPDGDHELVNNNNPTARAEAQSLLEVVGLGPWLTAQKYDLESVQDWHSVLSGGQKQRLAWVRMFFHRPDFALIDEGTSAVDRDSVDLLFLHAKEQLGITMLTISHSEVVDAHHKQALDLDQGGRWQITDDVATPRDGTDSPDAAATQAEKSASNALEELLEELEKALATHKSEGSDTPGSALGRDALRILAALRAEIER